MSERGRVCCDYCNFSRPAVNMNHVICSCAIDDDSGGVEKGKHETCQWGQPMEMSDAFLQLMGFAMLGSAFRKGK